MKTFRLLLIALFCTAPWGLHARENPYDVLSQVLMPFVQVLAEKGKSPDRAVTFTAQLEALTGMPPELAGATVDLALQYPDKLRIEAPVLGQRFTICRRGQELWVSPGSKLKALLEASGAEEKLPPPNKKYELAPLKLPIPEKQLVFLPVLFQARDAGTEVVGEQTCRVLDLQLMPELARSLTGDGPTWTARVWVDPQNKPARLAVQRPGWGITLRFQDVKFAPSLPKSTWRPTEEEAGDAMKIEPSRYDQLLRGMVGAKR